MVMKMCRITFSIGKQYMCEVLCENDMDIDHVILGRPWQYDIVVVYACRQNTYAFDWKGKKIRLLTFCYDPKQNNKETNAVFQLVDGRALLATGQTEIDIMALVVTDTHPNSFVVDTPDTVRSLLKQFEDIAPAELPEGLSPL
ncbi:uncharacterized protein LOC110106623 [Dendrobium catenatum]|uniref:uncharacterized protein LOC110106623 n=1 Tax=Dendrobium catenatum TaxID=906689 RepID=UPI0009F6A02C|nr:uncharacterized protein LOC110106623 [Dendrobium catenatum]